MDKNGIPERLRTLRYPVYTRKKNNECDKSEFDEERDCMGKAILAMIVTVIVGYISGAIFANWVNAPEWGVILAVAVMGAFIIYFNDKKQ